MGKLADIVGQQHKEAIKPAITRIGPHEEGNPIFTSEEFRGFGDFLSDEPEQEPEINPQREKMMSVFTIMRMLMKMLD